MKEIREVRVEDLIGRKVHDPSGKPVGRLEEIEAEWQGGQLTVRTFLLGVRGLLERLSVETWRAHEAGVGPSYVARPDQMDLTDPEHPRLTCPASQLTRLESADRDGSSTSSRSGRSPRNQKR